MSRAIVFDVGGVLLDWRPHYLYRQMLPDDASIDSFLVEVGFNDWNVAQDAGRPWDEAVSILSRQFPHRSDLIEAAHLRWHDMVRSPIHGTVDILEKLAAAHVPLYAITNFSSEKFAQSRQRHAFFRHFCDIVVSGDEKMLKPDPAIYQLLLDRNSLTASSCTFIDDVSTNLAGARLAGMDAIHFTTPEDLAAALTQRGVLQ